MTTWRSAPPTSSPRTRTTANSSTKLTRSRPRRTPTSLISSVCERQVMTRRSPTTSGISASPRTSCAPVTSKPVSGSSQGCSQRPSLNYGIDVVEVGAVKNVLYEDALTELQDAGNRNDPRPLITTRHDARVMAWLDELPVESARVLCTWDRRFLNQLDASRHTWIVVDPPVLSDLLALAAGGEELPLTSPLTLIEMIGATAEDPAAAVWDWLAAKMKGSLSDAYLRRRAKKFVDTYVGAHVSIDPSELEAAWTAWRNQTRDHSGQSS